MMCGTGERTEKKMNNGAGISWFIQNMCPECGSVFPQKHSCTMTTSIDHKEKTNGR